MELTDLKILCHRKNKDLFILKDDFNDIRDKYFKTIIEERNWYSLPGGIQDNHSPLYENFPNIQISQNELSGYKIDSGSNLNWLKLKLLPLLSKWENRDLTIDQFTICPSVTMALLTCFNLSRILNICIVAHETPSFFASVEQAKTMGFDNYLIPTNQEDNFCVTEEDIMNLNELASKYTLVLTQPKIGIGINRNVDQISEILKIMHQDSLLIIDEAADRNFPMKYEVRTISDKRLLRVKGIFKGLGLNGIRASVIFHDREFKQQISSLLEIFGGTLDSFSIKMLAEIAENESFFLSSLEYATQYIRTGSNLVKTRLLGSLAQFETVENGYLGIVKIPFGNKDFYNARKTLLKEARRLKSPLVLGSSMYFPYDGFSEWIRFNLFSSKENIIRSADIIDNLSQTMQK